MILIVVAAIVSAAVAIMTFYFLTWLLGHMVMEEWWPKTPQENPPIVWPPVPAPLNPLPNAVPWPMIQKDPELAKQMLDVLQRLEAIDKRLGLMEQCKVAQPEKKRVKARLRRIAKKAKRS